MANPSAFHHILSSAYGPMGPLRLGLGTASIMGAATVMSSFVAMRMFRLNNTPAAEVRRCFEELGLRGVKMLPIFAELPPDDRKYYPIYEVAQDLKLPVLLHMGAHFLRKLPLKCSQPLDLEDVALNFPELTIIIAHLAHPWVADTMVLIRKHPNLYADTSGLADFRPYTSLYQGLAYAMEYQVLDKLLFGTDWPLISPAEEIQRLKGINKYAEGTNLPRIPDEAILNIIEKNAERALQLGQ